MRRKMKQKNGITLIALVVTIIVLIILAGVSVNLVLGQNGIITKAKEAKKNHEKEAVKEKVSLMMGEYATEREENNKTLNDYLENQEKAGNIESIEQGEENEEGTQTIIVDDYRVVIDEETLEILEIEKAGPKPKITNIKITYIDTTDGTEKEATEKSVVEGTPLKITFDVSFEEGTLVGVNKGILENGKVEYTTDGTEKEVIFVVIGKIRGEEYAKTEKILLKNLYREPYVADVVQVGDYVNYSVGEWTEQDIQKVGQYYYGKDIPLSNATTHKFGGYALGDSKDFKIATGFDSGTAVTMENAGWRVLRVNANDGTIKIIHSGCPELYQTTRYSAQNLAKQNDYQFTLTRYRDYSMYEDCSTDSVDTNFAIPGSATICSIDDINSISGSSNLRNLGNPYVYQPVSFRSTSSDRFPLTINSTGSAAISGANWWQGVRPVITLKANIKVSTLEGQVTHDTPETAWILTLEE